MSFALRNLFAYWLYFIESITAKHFFFLNKQYYFECNSWLYRNGCKMGTYWGIAMDLSLAEALRIRFNVIICDSGKPIVVINSLLCSYFGGILHKIFNYRFVITLLSSLCSELLCFDLFPFIEYNPLRKPHVQLHSELTNTHQLTKTKPLKILFIIYMFH